MVHPAAPLQSTSMRNRWSIPHGLKRQMLLSFVRVISPLSHRSAAMSNTSVERPAKYQVEIRRASGHGSQCIMLEFDYAQVFKMTISDLKELLCRQPHCLCTHSAHVLLVNKGMLLSDSTALLDVLFSEVTRITAVVTVAVASPRETNHMMPANACDSSERRPLSIAQALANTSSATEHRLCSEAGTEFLPDFFKEESSLFGKEKVSVAVEHVVRTKCGVEDAAERQVLANALFGGATADDAKAAVDVLQRTPKSAAWLADGKSSFHKADKASEDAETKQFLSEAAKSYSVDAQQLQELECINWLEVQQFYRNCVADDGSFDMYDLPLGVSDVHIKYFAYADETKKHMLKVFPGRQDIQSLGHSMNDQRGLPIMFNQFCLQRFVIQNFEKDWVNGCEGAVDVLGSAHSAPSVGMPVFLYWPPGAVKRNGGELLSVNQENRVFFDTTIFDKATKAIENSPEIAEALRFWGAVQQFYRLHVAGDGSFDHLHLPCGVSELDVKFFAALEHVYFPQIVQNGPSNLRQLLSSMDTIDKFRFYFASERKSAADITFADSCPPAFIDSLSAAFKEFRGERLTISGLKGAVWLNGAECLVDDCAGLEDTPRASVRLYWPPDAVKRNGGKKASIEKFHLIRDYEYICESMPEHIVDTLNHVVEMFKGKDPICKVFLSLIDFSKVPGWYEPATMQRMLQMDPHHIEMQLQHAFISSPKLQQRFERGFVTENEIREYKLGLGYWCFLEWFPNLQDEIDKAISCLIDPEAEACATSLLQAVDLMPFSDTHFIEKMDCELFVASFGKSDLMSSAKNLAIPFGAAAAAKYISFLQSQSDSVFDFTGPKRKLNSLLQLLLFLIFQDKKEALQVISNRQFLLGVVVQSGGNFLVHLLSVFTVKCAQEMSGAGSQIDWTSFKAMDFLHIALHFPATAAVLLHRAISVHTAHCECIKEGLPCSWPSNVKDYLSTYQLFQNVDGRLRLRRIFSHPDVLFHLKPRTLDQPIQSIVLIKFALKLCFLDLSTRDNVVEAPLLQFIEEDLQKEALGRAILSADADAASLIACFFQADELYFMRRYANATNKDVVSIPVRIRGLQNNVWLNGAHGSSDLTPDSNGYVLVRVVSPADVAATCKPSGVAKVKPANLEVLGIGMSATVITKCIVLIQNFRLEPILKIVAVMIENQFGAVAGAPLKVFRDSLENLSAFVPFSSTIKHLFSKLFPGFVQMCFRFLNPSTRREVLEHLSVHFAVLTSFAIPPDVLEKINAKYDEFEKSNAFKHLSNFQLLSQMLDRLCNVSSLEDMFNFLMDYMSGPGNVMDGLSSSNPSFDTQFLAILQQAFPEFSSSLNLLQKFDIPQMLDNYRQSVQSGMPSAAATYAVFEKAVATGGPEYLLGALEAKTDGFFEFSECLNPARLLNECYGISRSEMAELSDDNGEPLAADIIDGRGLALEQRVRIKEGVIPEYLAGAEGTVMKLPYAGSESYGVLVLKPTSAWLQCEEDCIQCIEKKHLMILGKQIHHLNHAIEWVDEQDNVISKKVLYCSTCPKAHALQFVPQLSADDRCNFCIMCESDLGSNPRFSCSGGCVYSICQACYDAVKDPEASASSSRFGDESTYTHGIKVSALQAFKNRWQHTYKSMTTHQFNQMVMKPRTSILKTSYVNCLLQQKSTENHVGNANWFISHSWNAAICDTIDSVVDFFHSQQPHCGDAVIWFDIFCVNQHNAGSVSKPSSWYMTTFRTAIASMGNLLLSIDNWREPKPLERAWCILELHAISSKMNESGGRFEIAMPPHSRESFLQATSADLSKYFSLLSSVAAEQSNCSREADKESIHKAIRESIGFDGLNRSIYSVMTNWIIAQIQSLAGDMQHANSSASVQRMKALGTILCETGRYHEALRVFQQASQTWLSLAKFAPLSLGTHLNSVDAEIDRQIIRIHVHLGHYDLAQQLYDEVMQRHDATVNIRMHHTFGLDANALATMFPSEPDANGDAILGAYSQLVFYLRLIFSDADDPEFLEACGCFNNGEMGGVGKLQSAMNDPRLNLQLKKTSFQIKIKRLPAKHPWIASAMLRLAHAYFEVGECDKAQALLQRALPFLRRLPLYHPNIILALLLLAACHVKERALSLAAAAAEEALAMCTKVGKSPAVAIAIPAEFEVAAEQAVLLCRDAEFQLNLSSQNADVSDGCIVQFIAVMKNIGTDEARMEKVIINRGQDAADRILERIIPTVQAKMDEKLKAEGLPCIDVRLFYKHQKKSQSLSKIELQKRVAAARDAPKSETECDPSAP